MGILIMKKEKKLLIALIILVFIFNTILILNKIIENRNTVFQKLDDIHISIIAPIMKKNIQSKQMTKSSSNRPSTFAL